MKMARKDSRYLDLFGNESLQQKFDIFPTLLRALNRGQETILFFSLLKLTNFNFVCPFFLSEASKKCGKCQIFAEN